MFFSRQSSVKKAPPDLRWEYKNETEANKHVGIFQNRFFFFFLVLRRCVAPLCNGGSTLTAPLVPTSICSCLRCTLCFSYAYCFALFFCAAVFFYPGVVGACPVTTDYGDELMRERQQQPTRRDCSYKWRSQAEKSMTEACKDTN